MTEVMMAVSVCIGAISLIISTAVLVKIISITQVKNNKTSPSAPQTDIDEAALDRAKRKAEAEQDALEELLSYNIDTAYGIKHEENK